jgi:hypothetical protein
MSRAAILGTLGLLFCLAGCAKEKDYVDAFREQRAAWRELTDVLATIHDEKSMMEAKATLEKRQEKFARAAAKVQALSKPSAKLLSKIPEEESAMKRTLLNLTEEVRRVQNLKLPGGPAFFSEFQSASPGLLSAEQR